MIFATKVFADTGSQAVAAAASAPQASPLMTILPFAAMFLVFYFLMIRPQQKKMKEHETLMGSLQKGEEIITQAGIFGKIHGIADKFITVEVDNNVKIKILKSQVATVLRGEQKA
jgi:preprotein translocase subunit YajC